MLLVNIRGESKFELFKTTNFLKGLLINKKETCSMSRNPELSLIKVKF